MKKIVFIGFNALGDTVCTTPVLRAFKKNNPDTFVIYVLQNASFCRVLEGNPHVDLTIYNEHMYMQGMTRFSMEWLHSLPLQITETTYLYHFDINGVCARPENFHEHIAAGFSKLLNIPIDSIRPDVFITPAERSLAKHFTPKPYVIFSMHSVANPLRKDKSRRAKDWQREKWLDLARRIRTRWDLDIIAVGSEKDPRLPSPLLRNLYGLPIKITAALLQDAACVVSLENGIAHLSAAVDAPLVQIFSDIVPRAWAEYPDRTACRVIYGDPGRVSCDDVLDAVHTVIKSK